MGVSWAMHLRNQLSSAEPRVAVVELADVGEQYQASWATHTVVNQLTPVFDHHGEIAASNVTTASADCWLGRCTNAILSVRQETDKCDTDTPGNYACHSGYDDIEQQRHEPRSCCGISSYRTCALALPGGSAPG